MIEDIMYMYRASRGASNAVGFVSNSRLVGSVCKSKRLYSFAEKRVFLIDGRREGPTRAEISETIISTSVYLVTGDRDDLKRSKRLPRDVLKSSDALKHMVKNLSRLNFKYSYYI